MTINSIQSTSALQYTDSARRHGPPPMTNTAQLLGLSTSDLSSDLQSGKTLSSLGVHCRCLEQRPAEER